MTLRQSLQPIIDWSRRIVTQPREALTDRQRFARFFVDLFRYGLRQMDEDRAPQMAAALAYRTLFGLLPVIVVGSVIFKASQGAEGVKQLARRIAEALGLEQYHMTLEREGSAVTTSSVAEWVEGLAADASAINLTALGWIGMVVVIYSAISLMVTIENSFNTIMRAPSGRSWMLRVPIYWTVLTLGAAGIGLSLYVDQRFDAWIASLEGWTLLAKTLTFIWAYLATTLVLFVFYKLIPSTQVSTRAALSGAFMAAILIELLKRFLGAYFENALSMRQLYGSLGLIPLFMFWVYTMWFVTLFGLEVAATIQFVRGRRFEQYERQTATRGLVDPAMVLAVMEVVGRAFHEGRPITAREVADDLCLAETLVSHLFDRLHAAGYLHRLDREDQAVSLAMPPETISADKLLEISYKLVETSRTGRAAVFVKGLREAQMRQAGDSTLATLVGESAGAGAGVGRS